MYTVMHIGYSLGCRKQCKGGGQWFGPVSGKQMVTIFKDIALINHVYKLHWFVIRIN